MIETHAYGITLPTETIPFPQIHDSFAQTENGKYLETRVRFNDYRPDHVSREAWVGLLGIDVNNLGHMQLSEQLAGDFLRIGKRALATGEFVSPKAQFDPAEEELIRLTASFHDWGESVSGCEDKTYRLKTEEDEAREHVALETLLYDQASRLTTVPEDTLALEQKMQFAREHVLKNRSTKLGQAFNAVERLGYMRTALRAFSVGREHRDESIQNGLAWITADVFSNQTIQLLQYAEIYPAVREFLVTRSDTISSVFAELPDMAFDNYTLPEQRQQREKFAAAKLAWEQAVFQPKEVEVYAAVG
jgi:hypothetical protein